MPLQRGLSRRQAGAVSPLCLSWPLASLSSSPSLSLAGSCAPCVCLCVSFSLSLYVSPSFSHHVFVSVSLSASSLYNSLSLPPSTTHLCLSLSLSHALLFSFFSFPFPLSTSLFSPSLSSLTFFLSILRSVHGWDPAPFFLQPLSLTRPQCPTPTNQICDLIQLHQQKRRRVTLLISRLLEGGEEKIKIDFVLLLIRKIETLHLRSTEQHVVVTDVGSLHSCTGGWHAENIPNPASFLSGSPRRAATPGLMTPSEARSPGPGRRSSGVQQLRAQPWTQT